MVGLLAKLALLVAAVLIAARAALTVQERVRSRADRQEWFVHVYWPAAAMILVLAGNGLGFLQMARTEHLVNAAQASAAGDDGAAQSGLALAVDQISVVAGTCLLMLMSCRALKNERIYRLPSPRTAGICAQRLLIEGLLVHHWLAVLGLGAVFGILAGPGIALFLACELTLMWAGCVLYLKCTGASRAYEQREREQNTGDGSLPPKV
jgi:hypothetical protein